MKFAVFLMLILVPIAYAEPFDEYKDVTLSLEINGELVLLSQGDPELDYLSSHLKLIPLDDNRQDVLSLDAISDPDALIEKKEDSILYEWQDFSDEYKYGLKSEVRIRNQIPNIQNKINFPYDVDDEFSQYLSETEFIDINSDIREQANEIIEGETDYYLAVYKIADWTKTNIKYDLNTLTAKAVQKSSWVLENKEGVCDELTNLFISMLRSVGIPARFVTGTVYTNIEDGWGNHGWAEVYFPGEGWVSWDVTFGQYGWVDPSHLKLSNTVDSGESSVDYKWRSRNVDISPGSLELKTNLKVKGERFSEMVDLQIESLNDEIGFGSYVPILVNIENLQNYYLGTAIILTKGPEVEDNVMNLVLKPREIRTVVFLGKVPSDLDDKYSYTSSLEAKDSFGSYAANDLKYAKDGEFLSLEEAELILEEYEKKDTKSIFSDIDITCQYDNRDYYSDEKIDANCDFFNRGTSQLENVNICLNEDCYKATFNIGEKKNFQFSSSVKENSFVVVENEDFLKKEKLEFNVVYVPEISLVDITPLNANYNEDIKLEFYVSSDALAKNVLIHLKNIGEFSFDELDGKQKAEFDVNTRNLVAGLNLDITYEDSTGKKYAENKKYDFVVNNSPFYIKFWVALKNLFS